MKAKKLFLLGLIIISGFLLVSRVSACNDPAADNYDGTSAANCVYAPGAGGGGAGSGAGAGGSATPTTFSNPISHNSIVDLFYGILTSLRSWIAVIAIIFIVIGGLMYMMSAGNEKMITSAKSTITGALIGLAIAVAAPTFLKELLAILGNPNGTNAQSLIDNSLTVQQIAMRVLSFLLSIVGVIGIIGLVVGGTFYLTAYGEEKRIDKGKSIITYSIIGIVVALAALLIVRQVIALLS